MRAIYRSAHIYVIVVEPDSAGYVLRTYSMFKKTRGFLSSLGRQLLMYNVSIELQAGDSDLAVVVVGYCL